jgi:Domain of unknown function (DUF1929)/Kelch motif
MKRADRQLKITTAAVALLAATAAFGTPGADSRNARIANNPPRLNAAVPPGGAEAGTKGLFGPVINWPSVPIHWVLTPDGRVMNFGATSNGKQGGELDYSVWNPALGTGADAFLLLPNTTEVNTFCAAQWLIPESGKVLLTGGTIIIPPVRGIGINDVTIYNPQTDTIDRTTSMTYRRWYATTVGTLSGEVVALGGRIDPPEITGSKLTAASTPEVFDPVTQTWRILTNAQSDFAYGIQKNSWWYPHAWLAPKGKTFILARDGSTYTLDTAGAGLLTKHPAATTQANGHMTSAMYAPGKIISIRDGQVVALININGKAPVITAGTPISRHRRFATATVLPNGNVFVNGGTSADDNVLDSRAHFVSETWDPATGQWTETAAASLARLYHSNAILLPDATVLTGGGGLPGPLTNNNGEIYYPPYLYKKDGSGQPAPRPTVDTTSISAGWDQPLRVSFSTAGGKPITRVTLLYTSMATHAFNNSQRFQELAFSVVGNELKLRTPAKKTVAPPGNYLLFAIDSDGVPSTAKMIRLAD